MRKCAGRVLLAGTFLSGRGGSRAPIEDLAERLRSSGYEIVCASSFRNRWLRAAHLVAAAVTKRGRYDVAVVDLYSGAAFCWGEALSMLLQKLHRPFILALHGGALPEFAANRERRVSACLSRAAAVIAPSAYLRDAMRSYRCDIQLVPNPVHLASFRWRVRSAVRPELVWVRGFHSMYNPVLAARVVKGLSKDLSDVRLVMVGGPRGDDSLERTREAARELRVSDRIEFTGPIPRDEVPEWMNRADIFLNTTNLDNTPVSVLEAMASGLCVVTTDAGGIGRLVSHERDGLIVPKDDPDRMAAAVRRLITEPGLAARLSRNARLKAERFDWSAILPLWKELLDSIAAGGFRPAISEKQ